MRGAAGKLLVIVLLALAGVGSGAGVVPPAHAQDIIGLDEQDRETQAGPYTVVVNARPLPSLQAAWFIIRATDTASGAPAGDLRVRIITSRQGSEDTGFAHATKLDQPGTFVATVNMKKAGVWETDLLIETPDGVAYGAEGFDFEVIAPAGSPQAGFVFIGVAAAIFAGAGYLLWRIRRTQRERAARAGDATAA